MITYQTNIWEEDWRYILKDDYLEQLIARCNTRFSSKVIIVNNVKNRKLVEKHLNKLLYKKVIDKFYFVDDYIEEVLRLFSLTKSSFNGAYYVSSSELVGIYLCNTEYLLYFKGDSHLYKESSAWIEESLQLLKKRKDIFVANPTWNGKFEEARQESIAELDRFFLGYGFSDQCFLVRTNDFKRKIYNETHPSSQRYPRGNPFEAMINSYMRNHELKRITHKHDCYVHKNFKNWIILKLFPALRKYYVQQRLKKH